MTQRNFFDLLGPGPGWEGTKSPPITLTDTESRTLTYSGAPNGVSNMDQLFGALPPDKNVTAGVEVAGRRVEITGPPQAVKLQLLCYFRGAAIIPAAAGTGV